MDRVRSRGAIEALKHWEDYTSLNPEIVALFSARLIIKHLNYKGFTFCTIIILVDHLNPV